MSRHQVSSKAETATAPRMLAFSDDECVVKLSMLVEHRDNKNLGEVAALIARLAVPIE